MTRSTATTADAAALARCAAGDPQGLEALYAQYGACCLAHARCVLVDNQAAEDVVEAAFVELWREAPVLEEQCFAVRSWLLLRTHRHAVDHLRATGRRARAVVPERGTADELALPEAQDVLGLLCRQTRAALAALAPAERDVIALAYWGGYTQAEIAQLTKAPLDEVKARLHRAVTRLGAPVTVDLRQATASAPGT